MTDGGLGECERRSSSSDKWDIPKPIGSGVPGLPSSTLLLRRHLPRILLELSSTTSAYAPPNPSPPSSSRFRPLPLSPELVAVIVLSLRKLISRPIASC